MYPKLAFGNDDVGSGSVITAAALTELLSSVATLYDAPEY